MTSFNPLYLTWPEISPGEYDYTEEFTPEDERQWQMSESVKLGKQDDQNRKAAGGATFVLSGNKMFGAQMSLNPGAGRPGAYVELTLAELEKIADLIDKVLGREPRMEKPTLKGEWKNGRLEVEEFFIDAATPF